jgi:hypothetical protein
VSKLLSWDFERKMKKIYLSLFIIVIVASSNGSSGKETNADQRQREIEQSKFAAHAYAVAVKQAESGDPAGFLKLYAIATDDMIYTVEYSEVANDRLHYLLYSKTELWIQTFAKADLEKIKSYLKWSGIDVSEFPAGITSEEQFRETIFLKMDKIKGSKKETELIDYIFGLYNRKRQ